MANDGHAYTDFQGGAPDGADANKPGVKNVHDKAKPIKVGLSAFAGGESHPRRATSERS
jgi:hypothetical protein